MTAPKRHTTSQKLFGIVALAVLLLGTISIGAVTFSRPDLPFADERFDDLWTRTDAPAVRAHRPLYWGERPWWSYAEFYREGDNGLRTVQYFDKGRMELTTSAGNSDQTLVTSGLLVKELVSGRVQLGNSSNDVVIRGAATLPIAGDLAGDTMAPSYAAFAAVATLDNGYHDAKRIGEPVAATIDAQGVVGSDAKLATAATKIAQYDETTGHNIPVVFRDFFGRRGLIQTGRQVSEGLLIDWTVTLGHPITDPYWVRTRVGGVERTILVQLFERRVLTYTRENAPGYEVEFGNVGQHYVAWRYPQLGQPWVERAAPATLVYATTSDNETTLQQWTAADGARTVAGAPEGLLPFSVRRSWGTDALLVAGDATNGDAAYRQLYAVPIASDGIARADGEQTLRLTFSDGAAYLHEPYAGALPRGAANEYQPAISPDGSKVAFISDRTGNPELFLMAFGGGNPLQLTSSDCVSETPSWSPDGRVLVWANNCDGDFELYGGELSYDQDDGVTLAAALTNVRKLTDNTTDDRAPGVAPDGSRIAFTSMRDGKRQIAVMDIDGGEAEALMTSDANDDTPAWSPDASALAFTSDRTGSSQIFMLDLTTGGIMQLTQGDGESSWPVWVR